MGKAMHHIRAVTIFLLLAATAVAFAQQQSARRPAPERPDAGDSPGSISGRVIAEGGHPVAGASVIAMPATMSTNVNASMSSILRPSLTDEDGRFQVKDLARGAYTIQILMPGYVI
ncbi:MAG TPA: carboxypeptidase-like regulatory domain-containing protein, partial [Blastocatellia bacterium]|nr:carboxypeptidase-like regulatory domain-containing protein [Blastocatellia bacterium]